MGAKYMNLYSEILDSIEKGVLKPGAKLPSEGALMIAYDVSKDTVRKALSLLEHNGYIQKAKGKAAVVLDFQNLNFPVSGLVTFTELGRHSKWVAETIVEDLRIVNGEPDIMEKLELKADEDAYSIIRVRKINGEKIIVDKDYINRKYVPELTREICEKSIYEYFEKKLGLKISYARKEITVRPSTKEDRKLMDMKDYDMTVIIKSYVYLEDTSLFQYTESRHRPDKFSFVDFARRSPAE